jgi:hypothetical protein
MKILKIESISQHYNDRKDNMDLMNLLVEYDGGVTGHASMYRAHYDRLIYQESLQKKYNIPECDLNVLEDLLRDEFETDHFYDNEE